MKPATRRLILKLSRFQHAVDAANERAAEAYEMDSQMDAGEFSGPAMHRALLREENRIARRFGFQTYEVAMEAACLLKAVPKAFPAHVYYPGFSAPLPR